MLYTFCVNEVVCDTVMLTIRPYQRKGVPAVVCKQAPGHDPEHILVCRRMRLHGKLANRLLSVDCAIFLQTVGFLLHRLMAIGGNQFAVSVVILPGNVGLMTRLTVMTTELHH